MIVVNISSGLGNQLFQYAAGRALSLLNNVPLIGDPISFAPRFRHGPTRASHRSFAVGELCLPIKMRSIPMHVLTSVRGYSRIRRALLDGGRLKYECKQFFDDDFKALPKNVFLQGYFQDRRYLLNFSENIINEISISMDRFLNSQGVDLVKFDNDVAALHVRRGDYLNHSELYPDWFEKYTEQLVPYLIEEYRLSELHIYSDDEAWCRTSFKYLGSKVRIMIPDKRWEGLGDLVAMSKYPILAIANSTFSWWAGVIAAKRGGKIIAPSRWSEWCVRPEDSLYSPSWNILSFI